MRRFRCRLNILYSWSDLFFFHLNVNVLRRGLFLLLFLSREIHTFDFLINCLFVQNLSRFFYRFFDFVLDSLADNFIALVFNIGLDFVNHLIVFWLSFFLAFFLLINLLLFSLIFSLFFDLFVQVLLALSFIVVNIDTLFLGFLLRLFGLDFFLLRLLLNRLLLSLFHLNIDLLFFLWLLLSDLFLTILLVVLSLVNLV